MKRIKIAAAALVLVAGIAASAFTPTRTPSDFRFDPNQASGVFKRQIATGSSISIVPSELADDTKWTSGLPSVTFTASGDYLRALRFEADVLENGGADGSLSISEAVEGVKDYYISHSSTLPLDGQSITVDGVSVIVKRSGSNIN